MACWLLLLGLGLGEGVRVVVMLLTTLKLPAALLGLRRMPGAAAWVCHADPCLRRACCYSPTGIPQQPPQDPTSIPYSAFSFQRIPVCYRKCIWILDLK